MNIETVLSEPQGRLAVFVGIGWIVVMLAIFFAMTRGEARFQAQNPDDEH